MAMARYNPTARAASRTMPSNGKTGTTDPTRGYANQDGPGNTTIDYGPHRGGFTPPTPPTNYVDHATPFYDQQHAGDVQRRADLLAGNDAYQQAKAAGDLRGQIAAMQAMRGQMQQDRFVAQGGTPETWANRFSNENNWPRPTSSIGYSHGPGRPDYATRGTNPSPYGPGNTAPAATQGVRRGATPQANAPMSAGAPPMQNPMFQGYQSGGAGVSSGGGGIGGVAGPAKAGGTGMSYGSYGGGGAAPSGGGGNMMIASQGGGGGYGQYLGGGGNMGGGNMMVSQGGGGGYGQYLGGGGNMGGGNMMIASQGGGGGYGQYLGGGGNMGGGVGTSFAINNPFAFNGGMTMGGGNPFASMGGGETGMMYPGGGMPQGGNPFGGYSRPGYSPFDSGNYSMPYDNGGMWQMFGGSPMGGGRGMNYAQMQNYLGLQPQGAPNWIGL